MQLTSRCFRTLYSGGSCLQGEAYSNACTYISTYHANLDSAIRLQISRHRIYQDFLRLGKERPGAIFLEMATCGKWLPFS